MSYGAFDKAAAWHEFLKQKEARRLRRRHREAERLVQVAKSKGIDMRNPADIDPWEDSPRARYQR